MYRRNRHSVEEYVKDPNGFIWLGSDIRMAAQRAVDYFTSYEFQSQCIPAWNSSDPRVTGK